ncbi:F-box protein [Parachlamydia sp. AcF125]|uniref:F-box protein n=1 Tax=Parachlamydia sp. AcF125 TaxID=2795736 RepID=UPI001BC9F661|nr:F-box protein [Parachlamydia sp. AcF125]MBS4167602.1 hypothetical protein [Parachlamydia sp. AcF125]
MCIYFSFFNPFSWMHWGFLPGSTIQSAPINKLPDEVILHIFSFLSPIHLTTAELVCRQWKRIGQEEVLWKQLHQKYFGPKPLRYIFPKLKPYSFKKSYLVKCEVESAIKTFKEKSASMSAEEWKKSTRGYERGVLREVEQGLKKNEAKHTLERRS